MIARDTDEENRAAEARARAAEAERRNSLGPRGRLREDGRKFQEEILANQNMLVTLEISRSDRAQCRAEADCLFLHAGAPRQRAITTETRIRVDGVDSLSHWAPTTYFYHVLCFEEMVDLEELLPTKFKLDPQTGWGLLARKWFEHKGCIDVDKIAAFIEAFKAYHKDYSGFSTRWIKWSTNHQKCAPEQATCTCPPKPHPPEKPVLKDYAAGEGERMSLAELALHENFDDMRSGILVTYTEGFMIREWKHPEIEGWIGLISCD